MKTLIGVIFMVALLSVTPALWAQQTTESQTAGQSPHDCQMMGEQHQQMMQEIAQKDQQLQQKIDAMNAAQGDARIQAMADVINEMASQRKEMRERMSQMHTNMMGHMAGHMSSAQGMQRMSSCPMMQGGGHMHGSTTKPKPQDSEQPKPVE